MRGEASRGLPDSTLVVLGRWISLKGKEEKKRVESVCSGDFHMGETCPFIFQSLRELAASSRQNIVSSGAGGRKA
jgi:hypothetical protein